MRRTEPPFSYRELSEIPISEVLGRSRAERAEAFKEVGIESVLDLLLYYPRRYIDRRAEKRIAEVAIGEEVTIAAEVVAVHPARRVRSGRTLVEVELKDQDGYLMWALFFNQPWRERQLRAGHQVAVFGKVGTYRKRKSMTNPVVDVFGSAKEPQTGRIVALYPASEKANLTSQAVAAAVGHALKHFGQVRDPLKESLLKKLGLLQRADALRAIHLPADLSEVEQARRRLAFDELLRIQVPLYRIRRDFRALPGVAHHDPRKDLKSVFHQVLSKLSFSLTGAQERCVDEIVKDMVSQSPMHRLLQGDVGSGKTVVAALAIAVAISSGKQAAFMVPTEVLAEQHHRSLKHYFEGIYIEREKTLLVERPVRVELLTSSVPAARRARILRDLAQGEVDLVIGTHALITEDVKFYDLSLVIVDEQHRFGVEQRAALRAKSSNYFPDTLIMTATPIPRTAAMVIYGDLEQSVIDEMPPGRTPVKTRWLKGRAGEEEAFARVREEVARGHKAYVICAAIEEDGKGGVRSVRQEARRLAEGPLKGIALAPLHGRMSSKEKDEVMGAFRSGTYPVLVSTTVVEVGVDVPDATVMVVLDADLFGIAQLHQLRGRVGRSELESWCYLVTDEEVGNDAIERLLALEQFNNGFELAEKDLEIRGSGTILGTAQQGRSDLRLANLFKDSDLVVLAKRLAEKMVEVDPTLSQPPLDLLKDEIELLVGSEKEAYIFKN